MKKLISLVLLLVCSCAFAKDKQTVVVWPSEQKPVIRFTFGTFRKIGSYGGQSSFQCEVMAQNLWGKPIPNASFNVQFVGKDNVRIGEGWISLSRVGASETVKFNFNFTTIGDPESFKLVPSSVPAELAPLAPPKQISMNVYSVPAGANLKVDGQEMGTTPKLIRLAVGKHKLEFTKEGFAAGTFPLEIGPDDVSGGTVTFELGGLARDTIELRDGTVLTGDVQSMDATTVVVRLNGNMQVLERNKVKRLLLVEREDPAPGNIQ